MGALILVAMALSICTAVGTSLAPSRLAPGLSAIGNACASVCTATAGAIMLFQHGPLHAIAQIRSFPLGAIMLEPSRLASAFLICLGVVTFFVSIFSLRYVEGAASRFSPKAFGIWYSLLVASLTGIFVAGNIVTFFVAWELMAICSALLVASETRKTSSVSAAWLMLIMSEVGALAFLCAFFLLASVAHSQQFTVMASHSAQGTTGIKAAVFLLSFFGFSTKVGLIPVNSWLARAHPVAPGPVSALLSAVILNCGIYGIVLINVVILPAGSLWMGIVVLGAGTLSAIIGILYACIHRDIKAILAHSSVENMGLVAVALGVGMIFRADHAPVLAGLAFTVALLQMINHSIYKALLFLGVSAVTQATGSHTLDQLGGLGRRMPWTAATFAVGAMSIAALPPFSGFTSEWLLIQTLLQGPHLHSMGIAIACAIAGIIVALTAALSVTCFVRLFAMGWLGHARSVVAERATEVPWSMRLPMLGLAGVCVAAGLLPTLIIPLVARAIVPGGRGSVVANTLIPHFFAPVGHSLLNANFERTFWNIGAGLGRQFLPGQGMVILHQGQAANPVMFAIAPFYGGLVFLLLLALTWVAVRIATRNRTAKSGPVWAGGIPILHPEMTYTGTAFARPVRVIFHAIFHSQRTVEERMATHEYFRTQIRSEEGDKHIVDWFVLDPVAKLLSRMSWFLLRIHAGRLRDYTGVVFLMFLIVILVGLFR